MKDRLDRAVDLIEEFKDVKDVDMLESAIELIEEEVDAIGEA